MKKHLILLTFLSFFVCCSTIICASSKHFIISNLKTEYTETPLGIDVHKPRFSWQMYAEESGAYQQAYQIVVTDELNREAWNSGKIKSGISLNIKYNGEPLKPMTRYKWKLAVWDKKNKKYTSESWFETGLMSSSISAWDEAKWIGGSDDDMILCSHYLPVFRIEYKIQLDAPSKSTKAGFVFGANDGRLMDKNMNIFQLESGKDKSYFMLELDITPLTTHKEALLKLYRVGYHPNDKKDVPLKVLPVPISIINNENKYNEHQIGISNDLGNAIIYVQNKEVGKAGINPINQGGDYMAFPVVGDIGYAVPENQTATFSEIQIRNFRTPENILAKESGENISGGKSGVFKTHNPSRNSMPMLRTVFSAEKEIAKGRLYITSRGIYDFYVNGKRVTDDYFNPGSTQYNKTLLYQTFDITSILYPGENAMGAILGEGWWSGGATFYGGGWNFFGDRQSLLANMVVTYTDGTEDVVVTNPETWKYFNDGPVIYGSFFQGEIYDTKKEAQVAGWSTASYNDSKWHRASEVPLTGTIAFEEKDYAGLQIIGQYGQTVKQIKELTAQSVEEVRPGVYVYDMGQNMVGVPKINLTGMKPGQKINLRYAEVKYPNLPEYQNNVGMIMLENVRAAMSQDIYFAKGGTETIQPRFTFHGYRFVEITGIEKPLPLDAVKGTVISSIHELSSSYETSNPKVNKFWENITWSMYGNFLSIPTDCPQRNERLGWSGDISVFSRAATYLADVPQFLRRHMHTMRDTQRSNGRFPDVAPLDIGFGGILWGSAGITVTWESYQQYNDKDLLTEHYDAMKKYINYILDETIEKETNLIVQNRAWGDLADWLGPEDNRNDRSLLWEAYFIYDLELMEKIATTLGKSEDALWFANLHKERKDLFNRTYIQEETGKTIFSAFDSRRQGDIIDTQTSYILPLVFNVSNQENKEQILENLVETVKRENKADNGKICPPYSLMTGFIGTAWVNKTLSDNGYTDIAYKLLQQTTYPSWLYSVEQGATTIWERLNSYTHTDGFGGNNHMNSFNHYSFGAVASWMYNYSLGIERDENSPGFKHFFIKPEPDPTGQMTFVKGHYDSMYGRIESSWEIRDGVCYYYFTVPANTTATLFLKAKSKDAVLSGKKSLVSHKGVKYIGVENGKQIFEIQAGKYELQIVESN
ncbi:MAG: family 78 glycoside hydrolase catalytic domain [Tissierellia bacterium]|nr:family 78 glycoside hydrolase catalytic domain [Tissierellia bacterium]